jgi:hypothetical protein
LLASLLQLPRSVSGFVSLALPSCGIIALRVADLHHSAEQVCAVMLFEDQRRTKPLRITLDMLVNPFTRPLGERPNECSRSLTENADVGFVARNVSLLTLHCCKWRPCLDRKKRP